MSGLVNVGRLASAFGVKGWLKVVSDTQNAANIFDYQPWYIKTAHGVKPAVVEEWRPHGKGFIVKLEGVEDRTAAELLGSPTIAVDVASFPLLGDKEFYWHQLEGLLVLSEYAGRQDCLGRVKSILPTGANDVLVVGGTEAIDTKERLIPYIDDVICCVDIDAGRIVVDWDPEF